MTYFEYCLYNFFPRNVDVTIAKLLYAKITKLTEEFKNKRKIIIPAIKFATKMIKYNVDCMSIFLARNTISVVLDPNTVIPATQCCN